MARRDEPNRLQQRVQALALDRLHEVSGSAERHAAPVLVGNAWTMITGVSASSVS